MSKIEAVNGLHSGNLEETPGRRAAVLQVYLNLYANVIYNPYLLCGRDFTH